MPGWRKSATGGRMWTGRGKLCPLRDAWMSEGLEFVTTADGLRLALRRVGDRGAVPVVLTHGTFSNYRSCMGLAEYLAKAGFACWVFDWRGHGASARPERPHSF